MFSKKSFFLLEKVGRAFAYYRLVKRMTYCGGKGGFLAGETQSTFSGIYMSKRGRFKVLELESVRIGKCQNRKPCVHV